MLVTLYELLDWDGKEEMENAEVLVVVDRYEEGDELEREENETE